VASFPGAGLAPLLRRIGIAGPRRPDLSDVPGAVRLALDPAGLLGPAPDYPSETFRLLQKNEIARFGEYRTERLVLAAFDRLTCNG
jgi:hypothetical protein